MENEKFQKDVLHALDKIFEELEFNRQELSLNRKFQQNVMERFSKIESDIDDVKASQIRMEAKLDENISALYVSREVQKDTNQEVITRLDRTEAKIDVLQLETANLRRIK